MMKIKTATNNRKKIIFATIAVILVATGVGAYMLMRDQNRITAERNDKTSSVKESQVDSSKNSTDNKIPKNTDLPPKSPSQPQASNDHTISDQKADIPTPSTPPEKPQIARAGQKDSSIKVVATLQSYSPGYCELRLSKTGQNTISREADIVVGPSYYYCDFIVPVSSLPSKGSWNVTVVHHIGKAASASDKSVVEIE